MSRARKIRSSLCLLVLILSAIKTSAQYQFDLWNPDNGLPQNSINAILQTRDGYLWLTTFDGLVRFDGVRFTVFDKSNTPGIARNRFVSLFEDRFGDLWAALESGEVVRRHQGRFTTCAQASGLPNGTYARLDGDARG